MQVEYKEVGVVQFRFQNLRGSCRFVSPQGAGTSRATIILLLN
jgi:hypothetical protein